MSKLEDILHVERNDWGTTSKDWKYGDPRRTSCGKRCVMESKLFITINACLSKSKFKKNSLVVPIMHDYP